MGCEEGSWSHSDIWRTAEGVDFGEAQGHPFCEVTEDNQLSRSGLLNVQNQCYIYENHGGR